MRGELLQESVARIADRRPEATAVVLGEESLTYGGLEAFSDRIAHALHAHRCRAGERVALLMPKCPLAVASLLGVYKAGAILVPLDPESPVARLEKILRRAGCGWVLAWGARPIAERVEELQRALPGGLRVGWPGASGPLLDRDLETVFTRREVEQQPTGAPEIPTRPGDPAHLLFTSGSTGEPKGVVITHANVRSFVEWAVDHYGMGSDERVSCHSPFHFDLSTFDLFGAFSVGGEVHLVPPELNLFPPRLVAWMRSSELTQWFSVPSILAYARRFDVVRPRDFPTLRRLLWCGEVFPTPDLIHWMERLPHVRFSNLYGPTETTIASSWFDLSEPPRDELADVPIGRPCGGEELLVLDPDRKPVSPGETGEIFVRGVGVCPGYWNDPERTAEAFLPDPGSDDPAARMYATGDLGRIDGEGFLHFVGRTDSQIKSRGYRIELGEIEAALAALELTRGQVVTSIPTGGFESRTICCAYEPPPGREVSPAEVRSALAGSLPPYMLPARWAVLERLPRNANGKLDRKGIRDLFIEEEAAGDEAVAKLG